MSRNPRSSRVVLTARDLEVLTSVQELRFVTLRQLERLHFASAQTAARRLRLLTSAGLVHLYRVPAIGEHLVSLTKSGFERAVHHNGSAGGVGGEGPVERNSFNPFFLQHQLAITDFRISLRLSVALRSDIRLLGFIADYAASTNGRKAPERRLRLVASGPEQPSATIAHCPDGAFALERDGQLGLLFLEVDRGSETVGDPERGVGKAMRFYLQLLASGGYQRLGEEFSVAQELCSFRTLIVTTSQARLQSIRQRCGQLPFEPAAAKRFLWLSTAETLSDPRLLSKEWISLDPEDTTTYRIAPLTEGQKET